MDQGDKRLQGQDIFIKEVRDEEGYLFDGKRRAKDFLKEKGKFSEMQKAIKDELCSKCIDVRLFGAVVPLELEVEGKKGTKTGSITLIGPVQFRLGRSLHRVHVRFIKGTGAFASEYSAQKKSTQFTFREEYILPYSLISFYGVINENTAKETGLTVDDENLLMDGMWNGTKNLITRSKIGQVPRVLLRVIYKEKNFHIGDLDKKIQPILKKEDTEIRDISEIELDLTDLLATLKNNKEKIEKIELKVDERATFLLPGEKKGGFQEIMNALKGEIAVQEINI